MSCIVIDYWHQGRVDPVQRTVLGPVADFPFPDLAQGNGAPHVAEELVRVLAGIEQAMVPTQQLIAPVTKKRLQN
nr:hypothetical protein GCM10020185_06460 [Pseudomonas brassicacearum subsp. brassicacearum]